MTTAPMTLTELAEKEPPSTSCAERRESMAQGLMEFGVKAHCGTGYD